MLSFLFFIFLLVISIIFLGLSLVRWFLGGLFSKKQNMNNSQTQQQAENSTSKQQAQSSHKKIIDADEGEYIEYEEIKD